MEVASPEAHGIQVIAHALITFVRAHFETPDST